MTDIRCGLTVPAGIDLDDILRKSLEKASSHTKKVFGQSPLTGPEIIDVANTKGMITLASTVGLGGQPHLAPVDVVGVDGTIYLGWDPSLSAVRTPQEAPLDSRDDNGRMETAGDTGRNCQLSRYEEQSRK